MDDIDIIATKIDTEDRSEDEKERKVAAKGPGRKARPKDRWFDPWLCVAGEPLRRLTDVVLEVIAGLEKGQRKRARKAKDKASFDVTVEAVIANLVWGALDPLPSGSAVAVSFTKKKRRSRYDRPEVTPEGLLKVVGLLADNDRFVRRIVGEPGRTSTIEATSLLIDWMTGAGVSINHIGRRQGEELIILSRTESDYGYDKDGHWGPQRKSKWVKYEESESPSIASYRAQMVALNDFLVAADIGFVDDGERPLVMSSDRTVRRYFTLDSPRRLSWERNGRLFGAFWLNLKKHRRWHLRIDGEPIADLDYSNMFARLAYAEIGAEPPEGDLYDLTGHLKGYEKAGHRKAVKKGFNSLLNGGQAGHRDILDKLPKPITPALLRQAIPDKHPRLAGMLGTRIGLKLMFKESQILLGCLERLMSANIVALPMHDGLMVARSKAEQAKAVMREVAREHLGFPLGVSLKPLDGDPWGTPFEGLGQHASG